jgi:hypothetical protein
MSYISHIEMCRVRHLNSGLQQFSHLPRGQTKMVKPSKCLTPLTIVPLVSLLGQIHTNVIPAPYPVKGGHTCNITTVDVHSLLCVR